MKTKKNAKMPYKGIPFVTNLFLKRIETSLKYASLSYDTILLDVGCRDGYLLKKIRDGNNTCKCYGIEKNPDVLAILDKCDVRVADVIDLPFENNFFDIVFVLDVLEHVEDLDKAINEIKRVLKYNGIVIFSGPTETWFYKLCRLFYRRMLDYDEHIHTVYGIEKQFQLKGFRLDVQTSLPEFPIPELFRISKFKKIQN